MTFDKFVMFQTANGELFLANSDFAGTDVRGPDLREIQSLTMHSVTASDYSALLRDNFQSFACFVAGTSVATPDGPRSVEALATGNLVETQDHGAQPVRWVGAATLLQMGKATPVSINKGALGCGLPARRLNVSQQHRMVVRSPVISPMTGQGEALITAKAKLPLPGIDLIPNVSLVTYVHLLLDQHEIVFAEGAPTESLFPGPQALDLLGPKRREEIGRLLPEQTEWRGGGVPARPFLEGRKRKQAMRCHLKNNKPLICSVPTPRRQGVGAGVPPHWRASRDAVRQEGIAL